MCCKQVKFTRAEVRMAERPVQLAVALLQVAQGVNLKNFKKQFGNFSVFLLIFFLLAKFFSSWSKWKILWRRNRIRIAIRIVAAVAFGIERLISNFVAHLVARKSNSMGKINASVEMSFVWKKGRPDVVGSLCFLRIRLSFALHSTDVESKTNKKQMIKDTFFKWLFF